MESFAPADRVRVDSGGPVVDGIVAEVPSATKVIVAVVDPARGPRFRTVNPSTLTARDSDGPTDPQLIALIKRTPGTNRSAGRGTPSGGGDRAGFKRGAAHRSTGR